MVLVGYLFKSNNRTIEQARHKHQSTTCSPGGAVRQRMVRVVTAYERRATRWCESKAVHARRSPAARSFDSGAVSVRPCRRLWQMALDVC